MLNFKETSQRQEKLNEYIRKLSECCYGPTEIENFAKNLELLYNDEFRHQYSKFFPLLVEMEKEQQEYSIDFLLINLNEICNYIETQNVDNHLDNLYNSMLKLQDHLNLEYARYCTSISNQKQIKDLEKQITASTKDLNKANNDYKASGKELKSVQKELMDAKIKLRNVQTELIAVLSIFAAIVLTFSGGITYLTGTFQNISAAPFFKLTFFVLLVGIVLFNAIYLMFNIIGKIIDRKIDILCIRTFNLTIILAIMINFIILCFTNSF